MFRFSHFYGMKVITESCFPIFPNQKEDYHHRDINKWLYSSNFSNVTDRKKFLPLYSFTLSTSGEGREHCAPPCQFFDRYISTGRALKHILYDFSSNLYRACDQKDFFDHSNNLPTATSLFVKVNDCRLSWNCRFIATSR